MKVLYVTNGDGKLGGAKALMEVISEVNNTEIIPVVLTPYHNEINDFCQKNKIENYSCSYKCFMYVKNTNGILFIIKVLMKYLIYKISNIRAMLEIKNKINFDEINIIHTNTSIVNFGAILAKKYNKKHIWHLREFGEEDFNFKPLIYNYINFMNSHTDYFIAISNAVKKNWIQKGLDKDKIKLVYDGIEIENISPRKNSDNKKKLRIVYCGAISEKKGQVHLIQALQYMDKKEQKNIKIDFIGNFEKKHLNYLNNIIKTNNIVAEINFLGYCSNLREKLKEYDVAINCSKCEAFGRVTVEYMTAELCVIAANTGANEELIEDGFNGLIYNYDSDKDLCEKILYVKNNRKIINVLGKNAHKKVKEKFSKQRNSNEIVKIYKETKE